MVESTCCLPWNRDPDRDASRAEVVLANFEVRLDPFEVDAPFDEDVIALEYLLVAVELIIEVRGSSSAVDALHDRTRQVLGRALTD
jgi:hypothetical protein